MKTPAFTILLDGAAITDRIAPRLISLTLTDNRGLEADQLDLVLSDHDARLAIPPRNATLELAIGWADALTARGTYIVDDIEHAGAPDRLTIRARSADFRTVGPAKRSQSWHQSTVGAIVAAIAARHGLTPVTAAALASIAVAHIDQSDESDFHFLTRLAEQHDAIATVKAGSLLFSPRGQATTAGGTALPPVVLTRRDGDRHRYTLTERDSYPGVVAEWHDLDAGTRREAVAGTKEGAKRLRGLYATEQDALEAARAEQQSIARGTAELSLTLAAGRADLQPETPLTVIGYKPDIDAVDWLITECRHRMDAAGYVTELTAETRGAAGAAT